MHAGAQAGALGGHRSPDPLESRKTEGPAPGVDGEGRARQQGTEAKGSETTSQAEGGRNLQTRCGIPSPKKGRLEKGC